MILTAENIAKRYFRRTRGANHFLAVRPVSLTLEPGVVTVLTGRSGSGKTTLLNMLAGLLTPTEGRVCLDQTDLYALPDAALSRLRGEHLAVVPQGRSAVDTLTVRENILLPGLMRGGDGGAESVQGWLEALDIAHLADARPAELSGGELRRVAIARALNQGAECLLADEPTGDLDDANTRRVLELFREAAHRDGRAVLLVSHDPAAEACADRLWTMDAGEIKTDKQCYSQPKHRQS